MVLCKTLLVETFGYSFARDVDTGNILSSQMFAWADLCPGKFYVQIKDNRVFRVMRACTINK